MALSWLYNGRKQSEYRRKWRSIQKSTVNAFSKFSSSGGFRLSSRSIFEVTYV